MPNDGTQPPVEVINLLHLLPPAVSAVAAVVIRLTGADVQRPFRYVVSDIAGTLGLFYLARLILMGFELNENLSLGLAGACAAAGWAAVYQLAIQYAKKRIGG